MSCLDIIIAHINIIRKNYRELWTEAKYKWQTRVSMFVSILFKYELHVLPVKQNKLTTVSIRPLFKERLLLQPTLLHNTGEDLARMALI